jgi:O-antigen ligase
MAPQLALVLISTFVVAILFLDSRRKPEVSLALWVPLLWLAILASRPLTTWLNPSSGGLAAHVEEGSPLDRALLSFLIVIAASVLSVRRLRWSQWLKSNLWIIGLFLYCGVSILWSDFPGIALRRWIRALGSVMMVLVVASDADPISAVGTVVRRCAYILVPVSVLLVKYYRSIAVVYNQWTGAEYLVGVTTDKNALGRLCLISGVFILWDIIRTRPGERFRSSLIHRAAAGVVLMMTLWLLRESKSATSLGSFIVGATIMIGLSVPILKKNVRHLGTMVLVGSIVVAVLGFSLNLVEVAVTSLGRDMTFTDRTYIWNDLLDLHTNPAVGVGYDSLWLGDRLDAFVAKHQVYEAHNGYLEVYLELGFVGLILMAGLVVSVFFKAKRSLLTSFDYGRLRLVMIALFLLYNMTEAGYKATTLIFFVFLLIAMDPPRAAVSQAQQAPAVPTPFRGVPPRPAVRRAR